MGNKENITKEVMEQDIQTMIGIFDKYCKDNEKNKKNLKEIKQTLRRFKTLSEDSQKKIMASIIDGVEGASYTTAHATCAEKGHKYTKWEEINWNDSIYSYDNFCQKFGAPTVWKRECKVCNDVQVDKYMPYSIRIKKEKERRKARILQLESELAELKKKESKNNKRRK